MEALQPKSGVSFAPLLKRDAKELVVNVLSDTWPLSAKQIHQAIVKDYQPDLTYQAVHKSIKQLVQEGVVECLGKDYAIREEWLRRLKDRTDQLLASRTGGPSPILKELANKGSVNLRFDQLLAFGSWVVRFHAHIISSEPQVAETVFIVRRVWPANLMVGDDYERFRVAFSKPVYSVVRGNSPMDRALMDIPAKFGAKKKLGADVASLCDTVVVGDYVYNVYYSRDLWAAWDTLYENTTKADPLNLKGLHDLVHRRGYTVRVVLTKSPDVAGQLRQEVKRYFSA